jgi:hypothetical protein
MDTALGKNSDRAENSELTTTEQVTSQELAHHSNPVRRRASAKTLTLIADFIAIQTLIHALFN